MKRTMTASQMAWNVKHGFAWFGLNSDGSSADDWRDAIYTREGEWYWDCPSVDHPNGRYIMA